MYIDSDPYQLAHQPELRVRSQTRKRFESTAAHVALVATPFMVYGAALASGAAAGEALHTPLIEAYYGEYNPDHELKTAADTVATNVIRMNNGNTIHLKDGRGKITSSKELSGGELSSKIIVDTRSHTVTFSESGQSKRLHGDTVSGNATATYTTTALEGVESDEINTSYLSKVLASDELYLTQTTMNGIVIHPDRTTEPLNYSASRDEDGWKLVSNRKSIREDTVLSKKVIEDIVEHVNEVNDAASE